MSNELPGSGQPTPPSWTSAVDAVIDTARAEIAGFVYQLEQLAARRGEISDGDYVREQAFYSQRLKDSQAHLKRLEALRAG